MVIARSFFIPVATARGSVIAGPRVITFVPYSETFKDHLAHPRHAGELDDANAGAEETNPVCGDRLRLSLRIRNDQIEAARFLAYGCPPTLACGSALAEMIQGMTVAEALNLTRSEIVDAVGGLSTRKQHAASLAIETLRAAIGTHASGVLKAKRNLR
jgi:nitrogen fixation NifU-like protein